MSRTTPGLKDMRTPEPAATRPEPPPLSTATDRIEAVLRAPELRAAAALDAAKPVLETLQARAEAVRRRLQAQQAEHGSALNTLAHRDYTKLHVLLGGALAMQLREEVESTRSIFEGRSRAGGKVIDPSVYATLDRVARLIRQVTPADVHRCPPGRPGCGCLIAQITTLVEDAEAMPTAVTAGVSRIHHLEARIVSALKARAVDGTEEMAPPVPSAPPPDRHPWTQAETAFDLLN